MGRHIVKGQRIERVKTYNIQHTTLPLGIEIEGEKKYKYKE